MLSQVSGLPCYLVRKEAKPYGTAQLAEGGDIAGRRVSLGAQDSGTEFTGRRLLELTDRYPLYSNSDRSLMMLGNIFEKAEREDIAGRFYSRVVKDYPLSPLVADAKTRLEEMGVPVPRTISALRVALAVYVIVGSVGSLMGWVLDLPRLANWPGASRKTSRSSPASAKASVRPAPKSTDVLH